MRQSRAMPLAKSLVNMTVGYGIAVMTQFAVFPLFNLHAWLSENMAMGAVFTLVSIWPDAVDGPCTRVAVQWYGRWAMCGRPP